MVAVNLSSLQFRTAGLVGLVRNALETSRLAPHRLELEITETVLLEDSDSVQAQLRDLKALGVKISLDDFGSGYSALNYLWRFPLDKIKIDQTFIQALENSESAKGILAAIIDLGRRLRMPIVAEGIETEDQRKFLLGLGCDFGQGYLFGKPTPVTYLSAIILRDFAARLRPPAEAISEAAALRLA
jgi:EAL domain-containing protein (putative c-di-GMP-specific phosphodiesterase class I)